MADNGEQLGGINFDITVNQSELDKALQAIPAKVKAAEQGGGTPDLLNLKNQTKTVDGFFDNVKSKLKEVSAQGGRSSGLGQLAKSFEGGGALFAVGLIGKEFDDVTKSIGEASSKLRSGQTDAAGFVGDIARGIPVLGSFISGFDNIRDSITGEKQALEDTNASIELGNKLMEDRVAAANAVKAAVKGMDDNAQNNNDKIALNNAPNEMARRRLSVDIEYKDNSKQLADKLASDIDARKKTLTDSINEIQKSLSRPDQQAQARAKIKDVNSQATLDIGKLTAAAQADQATLDNLHTSNKAKVDDIREDLQKMNDDIASKLATTIPEKVKAYSDSLTAAGVATENVVVKTALFQQSLEADSLAEYNKKLEDLNDKLNNVGSSSKQTQLNELAETLDKGGVNATDAAKQVADYGDKLDQLKVKLRGQAFGDDLEKLTEAAAAPTANVNDLTDKGAITSKVNASAAYAGVTDQSEIQKTIDLQIKIMGIEKAQELWTSLKGIKEATEEAGKSDIQKQIDQMNKLADAAGRTADMTTAIANASEALQQSKVSDFVKSTADQTADVGLSAPDAAVAQLKAQGVTDPTLLADAWTAAAKKAGAELRNSVQTPMEKFQKTIKDLNDLYTSGAIDKQTYDRANAADRNQAISQLKTTSIEGGFQDTLKQQFGGLAFDDPTKALNDATKKQTDATSDNTNALVDLNNQLSQGINGTYT